MSPADPEIQKHLEELKQDGLEGRLGKRVK